MSQGKFKLPVTMLIITPPILYVAYSGYVYYVSRSLSAFNKRDKQRQPLIGVWESFQNCKQANDLQSIYKNALQYIHTSIVQPSKINGDIEDASVQSQDSESDSSNPYWWITYYKLRSEVKINYYNKIHVINEGFFSFFFWLNFTSKQYLIVNQTENDQFIIKRMIRNRDSKCWDIAKKKGAIDHQQESYFIECYRKTKNIVTHLERELQEIELMKTYNSNQQILSKLS